MLIPDHKLVYFVLLYQDIPFLVDSALEKG